MSLLAIGRAVLSIALVSIPVPLAMIAAAWAWVALDKHSAVRRAVDRATTELVAGAQIRALEATIDAERRLRMFAEGKASAAETANKAFHEKLILSELENEGLADELAALQSHPAPDGCVVDRALLDRLRQ
jgi:hypothetical protein